MTNQNNSKDIKSISNGDLLDFYKTSIQDNHYNPTSKSWNNSGFSESELAEEILFRMDDDLDYLI
jgi:hypothetical protein